MLINALYAGGRLTSSEPLAEVQRALLVVLVLHAPHPEAGGLLLSKLGKHCKSGKGVRWSMAVEIDGSELVWPGKGAKSAFQQVNAISVTWEKKSLRELTGG